MRNIFGLREVVLVAGIVLLATGCRKQKSTLDEPPEPVIEEPVDTSFTEPESFDDIDTSDNAIFREADLDEEMRQRADEVLQPVTFAYNEHNLSPETIERLIHIATFLREFPQIRLLIEGHCDERGSSEYNIGLGERRARAVKEYIVGLGIRGIRLEITSWGEERPVNPYCTTEECHQQNRRVEFKILER